MTTHLITNTSDLTADLSTSTKNQTSSKESFNTKQRGYYEALSSYDTSQKKPVKNPPWHENANINIARRFFQQLNTHFLREPYHNLLDRNNVKVMYSFILNIPSKISNHNTRMIRSQESALEHRGVQVFVYNMSVQVTL